MAINRFILEGNLTRGVEKQNFSGNFVVAKSAIAWNQKRNGKPDRVTFVDLVFFGQLAEVADKYLAKGSKVTVEGLLIQEFWEDKITKEQKSKFVLEVSNMSRHDYTQDTATPPPGDNREDGYAHSQGNRTSSAANDGYATPADEANAIVGGAEVSEDDVKF